MAGPRRIVALLQGAWPRAGFFLIVITMLAISLPASAVAGAASSGNFVGHWTVSNGVGFTITSQSGGSCAGVSDLQSSGYDLVDCQVSGDDYSFTITYGSDYESYNTGTITGNTLTGEFHDTNGTQESYTATRAGGTISGTLTNRDCSSQLCTQTPAANVTVAVQSADGGGVSTSATTDSQGIWSVQVPAGAYSVTPAGNGWDPQSRAETVPPDATGVKFARCAADAGSTAADAASTSRDVPATAASASACAKVTINNATSLSLGGPLKVTGTGWSIKPGAGPVKLYVTNGTTGKQVALATEGVTAQGSFTNTYAVKQWSQRATYPDFKSGCELDLTAEQGTTTAHTSVSAAALGGVVYYQGTSTHGYKSGDVYCTGENPLSESNGSLMVLAPNDGTSASGAAVRLLVDDPSQSITVHKGTSGGVYLENGRSLCIGAVGYSRTSPNAIVISASSNAASAARGSVSSCQTSSTLNSSIVSSGGGATTSCDALLGNYALSVYQRGMQGGTGAASSFPTLTGQGNLSCTDHYVNVYTLTYIDTVVVDSIAIAGNFRLDTPVSADGVSASGALVLGGGASLTQVAAGGDISLLLGPTPRISSQQKTALQQLSDFLSGKISRPTTYIGGLATFAGVLPIAQNASTVVKVAGRGNIAIGLLTAGMGLQAQAQEDLLAQFIADPPDPTYRTVAKVQSANLPTLTPGSGASSALARALNTLTATCSRAIGFEQALATTLDRAGGATAAGNTTWERIQLQQAGKLASEFASLELAYLSDVRGAAHALQIAHLRSVTLSKSAVVQFAQRIRAHGLPTALVQLLKRAGYTTTMLAALRTQIGSLPAKATSVTPALSTAGVSAAIKSEVAILRRFASRMRTDPLQPAIS